MTEKMVGLCFIFGGVVVTYLLMAAMMPALNELISSANTSLVASANMSNFPGTLEAVNSAPLWLWFIPGLVGIVVTCVYLKEEITSRMRW